MKRLLIFAAPFILIAVVFAYLGTQAAPGELTDDGYPLNYFWYAMSAWFMFLTLAVFGGLAFFLARSGKRQQQLLAEGIQGEAQVLNVEQTGTFINNNPQVRLRLEIRLPGKPAYETDHVTVVPVIFAHTVEPGRSFKVFVNPNNPGDLLLQTEAFAFTDH